MKKKKENIKVKRMIKNIKKREKKMSRNKKFNYEFSVLVNKSDNLWS